MYAVHLQLVILATDCKELGQQLQEKWCAVQLLDWLPVVVNRKAICQGCCCREVCCNGRGGLWGSSYKSLTCKQVGTAATQSHHAACRPAVAASPANLAAVRAMHSCWPHEGIANRRAAAQGSMAAHQWALGLLAVSAGHLPIEPVSAHIPWKPIFQL